MKPLPITFADARDLALARTLRRHGVKNALRIVSECRHRRDGLISVSLGVALQEQEAGGRNIFGADVHAPVAHERVTKARVLKLVEHVRAGGISNGVGPLQLTSLPFIEEANRDGGAWKPAVNVATGSASSPTTPNSTASDGLATYNAGDPSQRKANGTRARCCGAETASTI